MLHLEWSFARVDDQTRHGYDGRFIDFFAFILTLRTACFGINASAVLTRSGLSMARWIMCTVIIVNVLCSRGNMNAV